MVTRLFDAAVVMVVASFTLRYGILTMDAIRRFNSIVAIAVDVVQLCVIDAEVTAIWLLIINLRLREIVKCCMTQAESVLIVHRIRTEDMTMATTVILSALTNALIVVTCIMYIRRNSIIKYSKLK